MSITVFMPVMCHRMLYGSMLFGLFAYRRYNVIQACILQLLLLLLLLCVVEVIVFAMDIRSSLSFFFVFATVVWFGLLLLLVLHERMDLSILLPSSCRVSSSSCKMQRGAVIGSMCLTAFTYRAVVVWHYCCCLMMM